MQALRASMTKLSALPRTLVAYPGHGESAPLGEALSKLYL